MSNSEMQLVPTVNNTQLQAYGDRPLVKELMSRLMLFHPIAKEVGAGVMLNVAQLALLTGASPLPSVNEIHVMKDNKGRVSVILGVNYWTRRAMYYGGVRWIVPARLPNDNEISMFGLNNSPASHINVVCCGIAERDYSKCMKEIKEWVDMGATFKEAKQEILSQYARWGFGSATTDTWNQSGDYKESKNGRPLFWTAQKRAEVDLMKKLFPYIPGEVMAPGAGLSFNEEQRQFEPNANDLHWGHTKEFDEDLSGMTLDDINGDLFGDSVPVPAPEPIDEGEHTEPEAPQSEDKPAISNSTEFWESAWKIPRYKGKGNVPINGALGKLGVKLTLKMSAEEYTKAYDMVCEYARLRDSGMDSDGAVDAVVNGGK